MSVPKEVKIYLEKQIHAVDKELQNVNHELEVLSSRAYELNKQRDALDTLLSGLAKQAITDTKDSPSSPVISSGGSSSSAGEIRSSSNLTDTYLQSLGLRAAIKAVLKQAKQPLRPKDVALILKQRGYKSPYGGNTNLSIRVGNEMWRMGRIKTLRKTSTGRYAINKRRNIMKRSS